MEHLDFHCYFIMYVRHINHNHMSSACCLDYDFQFFTHTHSVPTYKKYIFWLKRITRTWKNIFLPGSEYNLLRFVRDNPDIFCLRLILILHICKQVLVQMNLSGTFWKCNIRIPSTFIRNICSFFSLDVDLFHFLFLTLVEVFKSRDGVILCSSPRLGMFY